MLSRQCDRVVPIFHRIVCMTTASFNSAIHLQTKYKTTFTFLSFNRVVAHSMANYDTETIKITGL